MKLAVGGRFGGLSVIDFVAAPVAPPSSVTVSVTLYVPALAYACAAVAPVAVAPSPNVQL